MRWRYAVALLLLGASSAYAQVHETIDVSVTSVDLIVTDAKGRPVRGLTRAEFEVYEAGKVREVTNLSEVSAALPAPGDAATLTPAASRAVLIVFDNTSLTMGNRRVAAEAVKSWVTGHLRPVDRIAVMTAIPSLQLKQPWTLDSRSAAAAVDVVANESTSHAEQERREAQSRVDSVVHRAATAGPSETVHFDEATQAVRVYAASATRDTNALLSALTSALSYFPGNTQKNVMLIVGEGVTTNPGADLFEYLNSVKMSIESGEGPSSLMAGARNAAPLSEESEYDAAPAIHAMSAKAVRDGILIYAINPGQNESTSGNVLGAGVNDIRAQFVTSSSNRAGYELLVRSTGGSAFYGAPPGVALAQISSDLDAYYSIGFRTVAGSDPLAPLVVKSKSGYRVRATRAAAPQSSDRRMREAVLANHIATPMSNDLKIAVATDPPVAEGDRRKVRLKVMIPVDSLHLDRDGEEFVGGFSVYVSSGDEHGTATSVNRQEHQIRWAPAMFQSLKSQTITFSVDVMVPAGLTQISVGVMDERSQQTGFERVNLGP